jgi:lipid A 3-O-deacylase
LREGRIVGDRTRFGRTFGAGLVLALHSLSTALAQPVATGGDAQSRSAIWANGVGNGFREDARLAGFSAGVGIGVIAFGGSEKHDMALVAGRYGWALTGLLGGDRWYRGNLLLLGELFGGWQFDPNGAYLVGITPVLRYAFATGSRWMPFVDAGAGISLTDINGPDLSGNFQFNLQVGAGLHYFFRDDLAFTVGYRWLHLSNAGIEQPNLGVNTQVISVGLDWFF